MWYLHKNFANHTQKCDNLELLWCHLFKIIHFVPFNLELCIYKITILLRFERLMLPGSKESFQFL